MAGSLQTLPRQLGVVEISKTVGELLIVGTGLVGLVVFFGKPGTPIERRRDFTRIRIERELLIELLFRFIVASLAQAQPCDFPVRIRSPRSIREALLHFPVGIDGAIVVPPQQIDSPPPATTVPATDWWARSVEVVAAAARIRRPSLAHATSPSR